ASGTASPSTPSSAPRRAHTAGSNRGSDSMSRRTVCSSKYSAPNLRTAARNWPCSSVKRNSVVSATRDLLPRHTGIRPQIPGQPQDPFTENVAHHLGRASFDGVGLAAQEPLLHGSAPVGAITVAQPVTVVQKTLRAKEIHAPLVD